MCIPNQRGGSSEPAKTKIKILRLMLLYCSPVLIFSGLVTIAISALLLLVGKEILVDLFFMVTILRYAIVAAVTLLFRLTSSKSQECFYINLGQHPSKLLKLALGLDSVIYITLCLTIIFIRYAIA